MVSLRFLVSSVMLIVFPVILLYQIHSFFPDVFWSHFRRYRSLIVFSVLLGVFGVLRCIYIVWRCGDGY